MCKLIYCICVVWSWLYVAYLVYKEQQSDDNCMSRLEGEPPLRRDLYSIEEMEIENGAIHYLVDMRERDACFPNRERYIGRPMIKISPLNWQMLDTGEIACLYDYTII